MTILILLILQVGIPDFISFKGQYTSSITLKYYRSVFFSPSTEQQYPILKMLLWCYQ